jgi:hypothetical protein
MGTYRSHFSPESQKHPHTDPGFHLRSAAAGCRLPVRLKVQSGNSS